MNSLLTAEQWQALGEVGTFYHRPAFAETASSGRVRFGLIADPQYADADPDMRHGRYYRHSLRKLAAAIADLNDTPLDFVVTLGDLVDRAWSSYGDLLPLYGRLRHPHVTVMGNHDADTVSRYLAGRQPPLGLPKHYFHFLVNGYRFVVIDGNDISLYCNQANGDDLPEAQRMLAQLTADGKPQAQSWNGALGKAQLYWLEKTLHAAQARQETVIVLGHYPLAPVNSHNLWNDEIVAALLCRYGVRAYFGGHQHGGGYQRIEGTDFITLKGMVDGEEQTPYAIVELRGSALTLHGRGPEISREL
ncbi:metallophosphoesterase [Sodalis ligni]|uniref:metallophosphoesterase n=1 Tax=Sodalis ligni TaxID=2697027 RepID=UPI00193EDD0D|nr:metallophosphoesterase [Sodalis ligni]QWA09309.1 metallophosphoesterase [Sodalis ligni]